ncbi:ABC transporter ATP-binding protein [Bosea caraganae]|uniref:ABC transporter ATP-binding protein n=2 Tax=Bosea caraganae TaxID=2763117 RepID=A0A370LA95_9HYPH|nr:ABC transporter ATP-binding protein [Bosea caraganae]RDJ28121.1 ABC transporter ATP-binding protein [Bosea caraganae]
MNPAMTQTAPAQAVALPETILDIRRLTTTFGRAKTDIAAVDDVSLTMKRGKTLCIVGESGSGKSVTARSILQIIDPPGRVTSGEILFSSARAAGRPVDLVKLGPRSRAMRAIRGRDIAMIFQEPMTSLSPVHTIGWQIAEVMLIHQAIDMAEARARTIELLKQVEIRDPERAFDRYAFEFSGGMRQRAMIAMALACNPEILIADEPTTALDVTTQAEILALIKQMQVARDMSVLFITHDMGVVAEIADEVAVMRRGKLLEIGPSEQIFYHPQSSYTGDLIDSVRRLERSARKPVPEGEVRPRLLDVRNLTKTYPSRAGLLKVSAAFTAVSDVSLHLDEGENLGIVGESGSGKSTLGNCLIRVHEPTIGEVNYRQPNGVTIDLTKVPAAEMRRIHRDMRMIFQDPFASLNPRMTIGQLIGEPLLVQGLMKGDALRRRVGELLEMVDLPADVIDRYPHAFSGGQRQRICVARALAPDPRLVIADEATSALDVTVRSQILDLLLGLQERLKLSYIMISHDLGVIRYFCDRVAVMYRGKVVETGNAIKVCSEPEHPYTQALLSAAPGSHPGDRRIMRRHRYVAPELVPGVA